MLSISIYKSFNITFVRFSEKSRVSWKWTSDKLHSTTDRRHLRRDFFPLQTNSTRVTLKYFFVRLSSMHSKHNFFSDAKTNWRKHPFQFLKCKKMRTATEKTFQENYLLLSGKSLKKFSNFPAISHLARKCDEANFPWKQRESDWSTRDMCLSGENSINYSNKHERKENEDSIWNSLSPTSLYVTSRDHMLHVNILWKIDIFERAKIFVGL